MLRENFIFTMSKILLFQGMTLGESVMAAAIVGITALVTFIVFVQAIRRTVESEEPESSKNKKKGDHERIDEVGEYSLLYYGKPITKIRVTHKIVSDSFSAEFLQSEVIFKNKSGKELKRVRTIRKDDQLRIAPTELLNLLERRVKAYEAKVKRDSKPNVVEDDGMRKVRGKTYKVLLPGNSKLEIT